MRVRNMLALLRLPLVVTILSTAWLFAVVAGAQTPPNAQAQPPAPGASEEAKNIPDQKLDAAAKALEQVATVKQTYQEQIAAAAPSDRERIAAEGSNALAKAVTDQGLSVEEYTTILQVAQNDPQIREKILQRLK